MVVQRFLLVTFPSQGHINPALQFAKRLISMGAHVTLVVTLYLYRRITKKINILGLSILPFSDGFDDGFFLVNNTDTDYHLYLSKLKCRTSDFVSDLIVSTTAEGKPFTHVIYTLLVPWVADVAQSFNLPTSLLWIETATVLDILYYYFHGYADYINKETITEASYSINLPGLPFSLSQRDIPSFLLLWKPTMLSFTFPAFQEQILQLDREKNPTVLVNTFEALESEALRAVDGMNMIPIGPLIPSAFLDGRDPSDVCFGGDIFPVSNDCVTWLDSKEEKSVVYVSFGSYLVLSKGQMEEIARVLFDCGRPFLWVIREKKNQEEVLELGMELEKKGKIVTWCSQVEVLSHGSVGCFLTHCGWNSTMESLVSGVPMVAFPLWTDQMTNAKLVEDVWKIGVRVDHDVNEDGIVEGKNIKRCLDVVMGSGDRACELRKNSQKWMGLAREAAMEGGSSENNLRTFVNHVGDKFMHTHITQN
ncbi:hypothetical protein V8G54_019664 [Vigna mungo]|uniref:Glycosyltransferase n=1 Tax=Vigna mungo TaxID=3915 RepID=A0AAQ3RV53_VIGMU